MSSFIDLTGQKFNKLTAIKYVGKSKWLCKCDCGKETVVNAVKLKKGYTKSCGCSRIIDLTGKKFGKLTVLKFSHSKGNKYYWLCECECGKQKAIWGANLKYGKSSSCGECIYHHKSNTRIFRIWQSMRKRCSNKKEKVYKYYGGKGITVCPEWDADFMNFYNWAMANGYTDELTIDRIDVNGNYEPSNCRWVTMKVQANNTSRNRYITYKGETHTLAEWCDILKLDKGLIGNRFYRYGWSIEKAFTTPPIKHNSKI